MSTITLMRLYLRYQSMPRLPLPCIGYAGTMYSGPLVDRQRIVLKDACEGTTASPELPNVSKVLVKGGSMGSYFFRRGYSTSTADIKKAEKEREAKNKFKLRTSETVKVLVESETGSLSSMTLEEANKLAKKKGLNLIRANKGKSVRSDKEIYKLVSKLANLDGDDGEDGVEERSAKYGGGGDSSGSKQKEVKTVLLKSNTGDHDVSSKINSMKKWIRKGHRIRVQISQAGEKGSAEAIFKNIETEMTEVEGQVQQKITKGNELRFYIGPPKKAKAGPPPPNKSSQENSKDAKDSDVDDDSDDDEVEVVKGKKVSRS